MTTIRDGQGFIEAVSEAGLDVPGNAAAFTPPGPRDVPVSEYGRRGIYVLMQPIPGLTPKGTFPQDKTFGFQCPPMNEFGEGGQFNWQDYDTISAGQHSIAIGRQLRTVQFDTILLDWTPEWSLVHTASGLYPAQQAVKALCAIRDHGKPFRLMAHQSVLQDQYEIDYPAKLTQVSWKVQAGEIDAYYVTASFSEFRTPTVVEYLAGNAHPGLPATHATATLPANLDTLSKLATNYYGDPSQWRLIAAANGLPDLPPSARLTPQSTGRSKLVVPRVTRPTGRSARANRAA